MKSKLLALMSGILAAFFVSGCGQPGNYQLPPAQYTAPANPLANGNNFGVDGNWNRTAATTQCSGGTARTNIASTSTYIDMENPTAGYIKMTYQGSTTRTVYVPATFSASQSQMGGQVTQGRVISVTPSSTFYCSENLTTACTGADANQIPQITAHTMTFNQTSQNAMTVTYSADWFCYGSPSTAQVVNQ